MMLIWKMETKHTDYLCQSPMRQIQSTVSERRQTIHSKWTSLISIMTEKPYYEIWERPLVEKEGDAAQTYLSLYNYTQNSSMLRCFSYLPSSIQSASSLQHFSLLFSACLLLSVQSSWSKAVDFKSEIITCTTKKTSSLWSVQTATF